MNRRTLLVLATGLCTSFICGVTNVHAETAWSPSGPIKLMIAFKAGGGVDTSARLLAEELSAKYGWNVFPENVAGRGGAAMATILKKEPADGLSIGMTAMDSLTYGVLATKNPGYSVDDFTYLSSVTSTQAGLIAKSSRGWKTLGDVIDAAKSGEKISAGAMSAKLADALYLISKANNVHFTTVMVKGGKGGLNGVMADDLDIAWAAGPQTKGVQSGDLVNLVSAIGKPLRVSPDAPLLSEYGVDFVFGTKFGVIAPAGLNEDARVALQDAITAVVNDPTGKLNNYITKAFSGPDVIKGDAFSDFMKSANDEARRLLEESNN